MSARGTLVAVVGANGHLGRELVAALLARSAAVRAVVRPGREAAVADLAAAGAEITAATLFDPPSLRRACDGAFAVLSAVQGGRRLIVDGQLALLSAAREAGVERFVPADYSFDLFQLAPGEVFAEDWRLEVAERAASLRGPVQLTHVLNGCFIDQRVFFDYFDALDREAGVLNVWGDGAALMDFTTIRDTARYTAAAILADSIGDRVCVAGDVVDAAGLAAAYERGSGRSIEIVCRGSLADLSAEIETLQARPGPPRPFLWRMYWRALLGGAVKLTALQNDQFPDIRPQSIAEYVAERGL